MAPTVDCATTLNYFRAGKSVQFNFSSIYKNLVANNMLSFAVSFVAKTLIREGRAHFLRSTLILAGLSAILLI